MAKQRMKAKVIEIEGLDVEEVEEALNKALKEVGEYYIHDVKPLGNGLLAVLYFTQKRNE